MISRRNFFLKTSQALGLSFLVPSIEGCKQNHVVNGYVTGPNASLGHRLRDMDFPNPSSTMFTKTLIVGGGVAGLSAARYLKKSTDNFLLIELEESVGGNAMAGNNAITAFPWGAHYLPLPGSNDQELLAFLKEAGAITEIKNDLPVYNEYHLCHDPKERLFLNNHWQEGIIPHEGIPREDRAEIDRFITMMYSYKTLKGKDGKDAFAIPVEFSSQDDAIKALDTISAAEFLSEHNFVSQYLQWYVGYCCADDYGSSLQKTSAWAMIHYFASRKGESSNATSDAVLTWPEGNYWLIKKLKKNIHNHIQSNVLAYDVRLTDTGVDVLVFDAKENKSKKISANTVILATPQFINQRLLNTIKRSINYNQFQYAPWMVANLTVTGSLNERKGESLCWDNVIYGSSALGYIRATHQNIGTQSDKNVLTYYKPLLDDDCSASRMHAYERTFEDWRNEIFNDLKKAHPAIEQNTSQMDVWLWGHGMIKPTPGFVWSENRMNASTPIDNKIFFAHSDLGGISIFEEAFYHGHKSAKEVLAHENK